MSLQNKITFFRKIPARFYVYAVFLILHVVLFNINTAEWGDSYRILRASEYIRQGNYPKDEKRPPLFSVFTSIRPASVDAVFWGRVVMFVFSVLSFFTFDKLTQIHIKREKYRILALFLFIFNPVYLYWSLRIMADVPLSFFVLLVFYLLSKWSDLNIKKIILLGFICALAILTRFEGYILFGSAFLAVIFFDQDISFKKLNVKKLFSVLLHNLSKAIILGLTTLVVISPWLLYRNPFKSKYFEEPTRRIYDFKMVWIYFSSILYIFGFTSAFYFIFKKFKVTLQFFLKNIGITTFIILELILILLWPAAIPRLFVPLIPFFIIILTICLQNYFESTVEKKKLRFTDLVILLLFLFFYIFSQYFLKLQFLILGYRVFALIVFIQFLSLIALYLRKKNSFMIFTVISTLLWCFYIMNMHRNIFRSIKEASKYASETLEGVVAYNDTSAIPDWYLNVSQTNTSNGGIYVFFDKKEFLEFDKLKNKEIDYLIISNEHNPNISINLEKRKYLQLIKEFSYNVNGQDFYAKVIKFDSEFEE
ncbi:glycosyltransferase family 39 protein [Patescibacteria group bacterium]|nr:glycosyltransferase family 39 protein [Patescibacteria group bacterium]